MESSPPTTPPSRKSRPINDSIDSQTLTSPSPHHLTIHEILLLPSSPNKRPKSRHLAVPISPRNGRRTRRKVEKEILREERDGEDDAAKLKKRRQSRSRPNRKENPSFSHSLPSSASTKQDNLFIDGQNCLDGICKAVTDLVMWKNVAKSCLWFGFGSILFLSSILSGDVGFSIISAVSHLGILILGFVFFCDTIRQRKQEKKKPVVLHLTEEDALRVIRIILPVINAALSKCQEIFSGEPLMTLKVAPVLLFLARYGHLTTPWRLLAIGFFLSFIVPKLYSCYYYNIQQRVEECKSYVLESWRNCSRKKMVAIAAGALLWNVFSVKMRIFAAFISVVILRYLHEQPVVSECVPEEAEIEEEEEEEEEDNKDKENMEGGLPLLNQDEQPKSMEEEKTQSME